MKKLIILFVTTCLFTISCSKGELSNALENSLISPKGFQVASSLQNLKEIINSTVKNKFGDVDFTITAIEFIEPKDKTFAFVSYITAKNEKEEVVVTTQNNLNNVSSLNVRLVGEKIVVDCTGKCDCRERYVIASGSVECTCDDCTMTITKG